MNTINETRDYFRFKSINGNRNLNQSKITKICNDIESGFNMLPLCPIIVTLATDEYGYYIIDGQHRFEASKRTNNPVYYVESEGMSLKQIALLNSRADKWKGTDFLNCYINVGIEDYKVLRDIMKQYHINIKIATDLLMFYNIMGNSTEAFQSGEFKCIFREETERLLNFINDVFGRYTFSTDRYLIGAVMAIQKKGVIDWERLKLKINTKPNLMDKQMDVKQYILNIERIYNDGLQNRELLT